MTRRRQWPYVTPAVGAIDANVAQVLAPVSIVLPKAVRIPRQHHLARRVGRVEINIGIQGVARLHLHGVRGIGEVVLVEPGRQGRLMRQSARVRRRIRADPVPGTEQPCPGRHIVVEPGNIVAVVIGDRQLGFGHSTQVRADCPAQRQHD